MVFIPATFYKRVRLLLIGILVSTAFTGHAQDTESFHLHTIFSNPFHRTEISKFIDNVLRQISSTQFLNVVDRMAGNYSRTYSDHGWYKRLIRNSASITPRLRTVTQLKALNHQKAVLSEQIIELLGTDTVHNVVEIGTPASYIASIKGKMSVRGTIYSINDQKRIADIAQSFSYNPFKKFVTYDQFIPMNDYAPISEQDIPSNSIDAVICVIGLHHIPVDKIDPFIASIHRILKPNGVFILRDHNVTTPQLNSLVYGAHSIFNLIMNHDTLATEKAEYRNFQSLDYWIEKVEKHGLSVGSERLLQQGDPTLNTMIRFTKKA